MRETWKCDAVSRQAALLQQGIGNELHHWLTVLQCVMEGAAVGVHKWRQDACVVAVNGAKRAWADAMDAVAPATRRIHAGFVEERKADDGEEDGVVEQWRQLLEDVTRWGDPGAVTDTYREQLLNYMRLLLKWVEKHTDAAARPGSQEMPPLLPPSLKR